MMGVTPQQAVVGLAEADADVVGINCGNGIEVMVELATEMREATDGYLIVHSNAGIPAIKNGQIVYPETMSSSSAGLPLPAPRSPPNLVPQKQPVPCRPSSMRVRSTRSMKFSVADLSRESMHATMPIFELIVSIASNVLDGRDDANRAEGLLAVERIVLVDVGQNREGMVEA